MRSVLLLSLALGACGWTTPNDPAAAKRSKAEELADARRLKRACGSQDTYERLKALAFREAARVRREETPELRRLSAASVIRMEEPVAVRRDAELGVTLCRGRLILELPQGAEDVFDGDRRLEADVEYAAQEAADGSGLTYRMHGAEPIVYRLAAFDLPSAEPGAAPIEVASAEGRPVPPPPAPPPPVEVAAPAPAATPVPAPLPPPPAARPTPPAPGPTATAVATVRRERPRVVASRPAPPAATRVRRPPAQVAAPVPAVVSVPSERPSFPCRYARTRAERLVCADPALARADRAMSAEFQAALADADPQTRRELRASRDRFLAYRDRCPSAGCVAQAYSDRVDEIHDIADGRY